MTLAAVFPGQGSQYVGMGLDLAASATEVDRALKLADELLGRPLSDIIKQGPKAVLDDTANAQPAIFLTNYLHWSALRGAGFEPEYLAGHSLGELSACMAAGVFSLETGLAVVARRAALTAQAASGHDGGMAAVLGLDDTEVEEISAGAGLEVANYNCPGQVVVAGSRFDLNRAATDFKKAGARKVVELAVSGAFHSSVMAEPGRRFAEFLEDQDFSDPRIPIISNATTEELSTAAQVKLALARQISSPVRWTESINKLAAQGVTRFVEVGPGRVLSGLIKRIAPEATVEHS
jgi:[acyl-carrier-protein] S-malonyltransferase